MAPAPTKQPEADPGTGQLDSATSVAPQHDMAAHSHTYGCGHDHEGPEPTAPPAPLRVGASDDAFEVAADRAADVAISRLAAAGRLHGQLLSSRSGAGSGPTVHHPESADGTLRRASVGLAGGTAPMDVSRQIDQARGRGAALPAGTRADMQHAFGGADFSGVRIHSGPQAAQLSSAVGAVAFTVGKDVFLGGSMPSLSSVAGQHTLAHELAHTLQPAGGVHRADEGSVFSRFKRGVTSLFSSSTRTETPAATRGSAFDSLDRARSGPTYAALEGRAQAHQATVDQWTQDLTEFRRKHPRKVFGTPRPQAFALTLTAEELGVWSRGTSAKTAHTAYLTYLAAQRTWEAERRAHGATSSTPFPTPPPLPVPKPAFTNDEELALRRSEWQQAHDEFVANNPGQTYAIPEPTALKGGWEGASAPDGFEQAIGASEVLADGGAQEGFGEANDYYEDIDADEHQFGSETVQHNMTHAGTAFAGFGAIVSGAKVVQTFMDEKSSAEDKAEAILGGVQGATSLGASAAESANSTFKDGTKAFKQSEAAKDVLQGLTGLAGFILDGFDCIKTVVTALDTDAAYDLEGGSGVALEAIEKGLSALKGLMGSINAFMGKASPAMVQTVPGFGIAVEAIAMIRSAINTFLSYRSWTKMQTAKRDAKARMFEATTKRAGTGPIASRPDAAMVGSYDKTKKGYDGAKVTPEDEATLGFGASISRFFGGHQSGKDAMRFLQNGPASADTELDQANRATADDYEMYRELQRVGGKRIRRGVINITTSIAAITGDILTLSGVGAAAGGGLKVAAAGTKTGFALVRGAKQLFRNLRGSATDKKTTKAKIARYDAMINWMTTKIRHGDALAVTAQSADHEARLAESDVAGGPNEHARTELAATAAKRRAAATDQMAAATTALGAAHDVMSASGFTKFQMQRVLLDRAHKTDEQRGQAIYENWIEALQERD